MNHKARDGNSNGTWLQMFTDFTNVAVFHIRGKNTKVKRNSIH